MRTIKFRGIDTMSGEMVYGDLVQQELTDGSITTAIVQTYATYDVNPETVGQFTGLHDKNGKEIYEGDILRWAALVGVATWHPNGYWCLHTAQDDVSEHSYISLGEVYDYAIRERYDYKVIGNSHDNKLEDIK